tara:strand:+ start:1217 stop:1369 length:153 start_codon:yes stop_codon:yes gene_type:complete
MVRGQKMRYACRLSARASYISNPCCQLPFAPAFIPAAVNNGKWIMNYEIM